MWLLPERHHHVHRGLARRHRPQRASAFDGSSARRTEEQIQAALAEHLCRCGTHHRILRTIRELAGHQQPSPQPLIRADDGPGGRAAPEVAADVRADPAEEVPAEPGRPVDPLPGALATAPNVEDWLRPLPDGRIEVRSGRAELGQGVRTALAQIVAAELGVPLDRLVVRSAATDGTPDEGYTAGSNSLEAGGTALARAAVAYRRLASEGDDPPTGPIRPDDLPRWGGGPVGEAAPRSDLPAKLTGAPAYVHDLALPGMLYARALLPPREDARPVAVDLSVRRTCPGWRRSCTTAGCCSGGHPGGGRGRLAVYAARPYDPLGAATRARKRTHRADDCSGAHSRRRGTRSRAGAGVGTGGPGLLRQAVRGARVGGASVPLRWPSRTAPRCGRTVRAFIRCAASSPAALGLPEDALTVRHVDGPGCYGHNGADDAAGFAVATARAVPGRPVRFQYAVQDEFGWGAVRPANVGRPGGEPGRGWPRHRLAAPHPHRRAHRTPVRHR